MRLYCSAFSLLLIGLFACKQSLGTAQPSVANVIFKSGDNGATWQNASIGMPEDIAVFRATVSKKQMILLTSDGLYRSSSAAAPAWEKDFPPLFGDVSNIFSGKNGRLYAGNYRQGFYQAIPGTNLWRPLDQTLEDKTVRAFVEISDGVLLIGCETGIYKSGDGGNTWKKVFPDVIIHHLYMEGEVLLGGTEKGILRSTDGGEHWDWVFTEDKSSFGIEAAEGGFLAITDGGRDWQKGQNHQPNRLCISKDGGKSWQYLENPPQMRRDIYDFKQAGKYLICSHDAGISRSADGGKTWELVWVSEGEMNYIQLEMFGETVFAILGAGC